MRKFLLISPQRPRIREAEGREAKDAFFTALTTTCRKSQEAANSLPSLIRHHGVKCMKSVQGRPIIPFQISEEYREVVVMIR